MKRFLMITGILFLTLSGTSRATVFTTKAQAAKTNFSQQSVNSISNTAQVKQLPPAPPTTPPPNRTRSGGSLGEEATCKTENETLMALTPVENPVLTAADYPTFLFYVPYSSDQVQYGEFSLLVGPNETTRLYQTRFTLPSTPGIVSLSLPESPNYALKPDTSYHWYFKLYCNGNDTTTADLQVDGWVQRVALTPDRQRQIEAASPEIWYDALATLAQQLAAAPQDSDLQTRWRNLLTYINATELTQEPFAGSVQITD